MTGDGLVDLVRVEQRPSRVLAVARERPVRRGRRHGGRRAVRPRRRVRRVARSGWSTSTAAARPTSSTWAPARSRAGSTRAATGWSAARSRRPPLLRQRSSVVVSDFLGDGSSCLVWSTPLPGRESPIEYLQLVPSTRPRLLETVDDSLGRRHDVDLRLVRVALPARRAIGPRLVHAAPGSPTCRRPARGARPGERQELDSAL